MRDEDSREAFTQRLRMVWRSEFDTPTRDCCRLISGLCESWFTVLLLVLFGYPLILIHPRARTSRGLPGTAELREQDRQHLLSGTRIDVWTKAHRKAGCRAHQNKKRIWSREVCSNVKCAKNCNVYAPLCTHQCVWVFIEALAIRGSHVPISSCISNYLFQSVSQSSIAPSLRSLSLSMIFFLHQPAWSPAQCLACSHLLLLTSFATPKFHL